MWNFILGSLFPPRTLNLEHAIQYEREPIVLHGKALHSSGLHSIDRIVGACMYDTSPDIRQAIHLFKYRSIRTLSLPLGALLLRTIPYLALPLSVEPVLCPVPLHWARRFSRGYNQAEILASSIHTETHWQIMPLLSRTRWTTTQTKKHRSDRFQNMNGVFVPVVSSPSHVVLIDDVCTTGATLDSCARALKQAGAKHVQALVIAFG
jgi:ComF family protein